MYSIQRPTTSVFITNTIALPAQTMPPYKFYFDSKTLTPFPDLKKGRATCRWGI